MSTEKIDFSGVEWGSVEWTNLVTLYLRAYESRSERSILRDRAAAEAVERIDYDFERMAGKVQPKSNQFIVALRAKQIDTWAADFLSRHPDATVLHLGCGLDSRAFRLEVPGGVRWFDVDLPEVIDLRRQLYSAHENYRMIGASVTDPAWLDEVPSGGPVLVVAEGLLMYLDEAEVAQLFTRIIDRFGSGEVVFDGISRWMTRVSKHNRWGLHDAREVEEMDSRLTYVAETSLMAGSAQIPVRRYRVIYRIGHSIPAIRKFNRQFRFAFQ